MKRMLSIALAAAMAAGLCVTPAQAAPKYPTKPITMLCMYGPGGAADLGLRVVAEYATRHGFTMNVVNKPAGGGTAAVMDVLKGHPDGYTAVFGANGLVTLPMMKKVGYTIDDLKPLCDITDMPLTFCVLKNSGVNTFEEWMELAKKHPGEYNYGSPGPVSTQRQIMSLILKDKFPGVDVKNVPYSSGHEVNTALLGGQIKAAFGVPGTNKNYLDSGDFKLLAVTSPERLPAYPDAPTFKELYGEKFVLTSSHGVFVNKKTPPEIVEKLAGVIRDALNDPEVQAKFKTLLLSCDYKDPEEFAKHVEVMKAMSAEALKLMGLI